MSLDQFKQTKIGTVVGAILTQPANIAAMERASDAGRPAAEAVGKEIERAVGTLSDSDRKATGRWIREILGQKGLTPDRKTNVHAGHFFKSGTVYRRAYSAETANAAPAWLAEARAAVRALGTTGTTDDLIADRRREAERERNER